MANELCTSLGLVGKDFTGKLIHVVEEHGSDSSFVLGSLVWNASKSGSSVCMLPFNNPSSHYVNVAKRLGYNFETVNVFDNFLICVGNGDNLLKNTDMSKDERLKSLYNEWKVHMGQMSGKKCFVVDDLNALLSLGASVSQVIAFLQYCRNVESTLIIGTHYSEHCDDQKQVSNFVSHLAECRIAVAPLKTGFSSDITGTIHVDSRLFHYKSTDRQIKVFAPGSAGIQL